jgi:hypothetical protein
MDISAAPASTPTKSKPQFHNYLLLVGGYFSLAFAVFQVAGIWWSAQAIKYLGGPAEMSVKRPTLYALVCVAVAVVAAIFGLYALSGAGTIRRLPLLRTGLITIAAIYVLRGLLLVPQLPVVIRHPDLLRFLVFSAISLCVGAVYVIGIVQLYRKAG